jgi:hypothetical protein
MRFARADDAAADVRQMVGRTLMGELQGRYLHPQHAVAAINSLRR